MDCIYIAPLSKALYIYIAPLSQAVHLYSAFIQSAVHLYSAFIQSAVHLYSAFIQSAVQFLPLIHPFTHSHTNGDWLPCKVPTSSSAHQGVRRLAQRHFDTPRVRSNLQPSGCQTTALTSCANVALMFIPGSKIQDSVICICLEFVWACARADRN